MGAAGARNFGDARQVAPAVFVAAAMSPFRPSPADHL